MSLVNIRPFGPDDLDGIQRIADMSFTFPWTRESMEKELSNEMAHYLVAEFDGKVVGYVGYWQVLDEGHIMNVAVDKAYRGQGIATRLVNAMIDSGTPLGILYWTLEVRVSNAAAIRVYENAGFTSAGIRPRYYSHPEEDANIMWLNRENV